LPEGGVDSRAGPPYMSNTSQHFQALTRPCPIACRSATWSCRWPAVGAARECGPDPEQLQW